MAAFTRSADKENVAKGRDGFFAFTESWRYVQGLDEGAAPMAARVQGWREQWLKAVSPSAQGRQCLLDRSVSGHSACFDPMAADNVSIAPMNGHRANIPSTSQVSR